eukprot:TRINITY_DN29122_c0_g1_i1.p1 TRINITY_DN29122_c0_g1~~TRINITY_DN29122_c0_g1_i1.p1  ORF type:complete len:154 (-),score=13.62 TRINITY_DN29122_c0_g1_i1:178-639(-)
MDSACVELCWPGWHNAQSPISDYHIQHSEAGYDFPWRKIQGELEMAETIMHANLHGTAIIGTLQDETSALHWVHEHDSNAQTIIAQSWPTNHNFTLWLALLGNILAHNPCADVQKGLGGDITHILRRVSCAARQMPQYPELQLLFDLIPGVIT